MNEGYIYLRPGKSLRQCSLCGRLKKDMYEVTLDGYVYLFCSVADARIGLDNYKKNKEKGLTQSVTNTLDKPTLTE